jgi:6-phosphogluconolactonase
MTADAPREPIVRVFPRPADVHRAAAQVWERASRSAVDARGRFAVALAGGSTPRELYEALGSDPALRDGLPWSRTHLFWGDERHVPPDDPESNYRMVREALLSRAPIPDTNVHRIPAELTDAEEVAEAYERTLRKFFGLDPTGIACFDLVILGMGADGHTASLFPGGRAMLERNRLVVAEHVASLGDWRITLTPPVFDAAARVVFLVSGETKAATLALVLSPEGVARKLPAALVRPAAGELMWLVDEAAAALLPGRRADPSP